MELEVYRHEGTTYVRCPNTSFKGMYDNPAGHWYGYWNSKGDSRSCCPLCLQVSEWRRVNGISNMDFEGRHGGTGTHLLLDYFVSDEDVEKARQELATLLQGI